MIYAIYLLWDKVEKNTNELESMQSQTSSQGLHSQKTTSSTQNTEKSNNRKYRNQNINDKLFSNKNYKQELIPDFTKEIPFLSFQSEEELKNKARSIGNMSVFGFSTNTHQLDLMEKLCQKIMEGYGSIPPIAKVNKSINDALFDAIKERRIHPKDMFFSDGTIRMTQGGIPYPFLVLRLYDGKRSTTGYFKDAKEKKLFIIALKKALKNYPIRKGSKQTLASSVKVYDEGSFLYIRYQNIISHVIRLESRKERISMYNRLKSNKFYFTLIIDDVGENLELAKDFMDLPFPMAYSIWPRSSYSTIIATIAHEKGFPVFLHQPMQALSKKGYVPNMGKGGLSEEMDMEKVTSVLRENLILVPYVRGINNHMGSRLTVNNAAMDIFLAAMKKIKPHILIVDSLTHPKSILYNKAKTAGFMAYQRDIFLDEINTISHVLKQLKKSFAIGKRKGHVFVIGHGRPETLKALRQWSQYKDENIVFALPFY